MIALFLAVLLLGNGLPLPASDSSASSPDPPRFLPQPRTRHTIRLGGSYQPGPGARLLLFYRYAGFRSGSVPVTAGWSEELFGSLGYTHEMDLGIWPARRLSLSVTAFSDFAPDRLLNAVETDERRSGGRLRAELALTSERGYRLLYAEAQQARVHLARADTANVFRDLSTLDLGARYIRTGPLRVPIPTLLLEARLRSGWQYDRDEGFVRLRGGGRGYRGLGAGWGAVVEGQTQWTSAATPVFEQASLGGISSVRGYRTDTAVGRILWTLQNELWAPVPGTAQTTEGLGGVLRQHVRLAAFFDVGGIAQATTPQANDVRTGLGVGLRLLLGSITLRVDWGHRTPDVLGGTLGGDFFLSARSTLSLLLP